MQSLRPDNNATDHTAVRPMTFEWDVGLEHPMTKCGYAYWLGCRGKRAMPSRSDLNPSAMRAFAAHVGLIEIRGHSTERPDYFVRLAGSEWEDVYGQMTGHTLDEFLPPHIEERWNRVFDAVRTSVAPLRVTTGIEFQKKTWLSCEMFVAPLGDAQTPTMLFMTFASWKASDGCPA